MRRRSTHPEATAPATHRQAVTQAAAWTPLRKAWPAASVTGPWRDSGRRGPTGATPMATASLASARPSATGAGTPAEASSGPKVAETRLLIREMRTEVPRAPPTWRAVDWRPPATPASRTGALPTMASEEAAMTMPMPRPSATKGGQSTA